ncbi:MAG: hypothetical protein R2857_12095 [Vampirovibrionales bacterium]
MPVLTLTRWTPINSAGNEAVDYQKALRDASVLYHAVQSTLKLAIDDTSQHHGNNHGRNSGIYKLGSLNTDAKGEGAAGKLAKLVEQVKRNGTQETEGGQLYLQADGSGKDARQLAGDVIDRWLHQTNQKVATPANGILAIDGFDTIMRATRSPIPLPRQTRWIPLDRTAPWFPSTAPLRPPRFWPCTTVPNGHRYRAVHRGLRQR